MRPGEVEYTGWFLRIPPVRHSVNALGYRGSPRPLAKPDPGIRILLVGDSSTFGQGVPDDATIAVRLEELLRQRPGRAPIEVLNFGVEGLKDCDAWKPLPGTTKHASVWCCWGAPTAAPAGGWSACALPFSTSPTWHAKREK